MVKRMAAIDDPLKRVAQREGEGQNIIAGRCEERDLLNSIGGTGVFSAEAVIIDGGSHQ